MRPMDPVRGRRKTARKELTHLPREDRRKTLSEKLKKNQPKRVDFPPQMAEFLLTEHRNWEVDFFKACLERLDENEVFPFDTTNIATEPCKSRMPVTAKGRKLGFVARST